MSAAAVNTPTAMEISVDAPHDTRSYADKILRPTTNSLASHDRFGFSNFLRKEYRFGLDPNRKVCPLFVQGHCPLGNSCPDKHAVSSTFNNLVCKHWLRSLCKKGEACEFLHEYNLRKMPECNFFVRNGYCSNGEECLYLHVDPDSKVPSCPHYDNGFCLLGPRCAKKHTRKPLVCKFFMAGFCPTGKECQEGSHPRWVPPQSLAAPTVKKPREEPQQQVQEREWEDRGGFGRGGFRRRFYGGNRRDRDR